MQDTTPPPPEAFGPFRNNSTDGGCIETADGPNGWKAIRDSKTGTVIYANALEWDHFSAAVRAGTA